jgi:hypothetical protein
VRTPPLNRTQQTTSLSQCQRSPSSSFLCLAKASNGGARVMYSGSSSQSG